MTRHLTIIILIIILFSCKKSNVYYPDDSDYNSNHGTEHIRENPEIRFYLNIEANMLTELTLRETFIKWNELTHFNFTYGGRNEAGLRKDGKNTVSFMVKWPDNIPINKIAWCQNWYDKKGRIIESDIIFNMLITKFTTKRTNSPDSYYIEGVLSHEIGHMIGLPHIESEDSVMKVRSSPEESFFKGEIDELTINAYRKLYKDHILTESGEK